jgi:DnaJ-class molecular chaperone
MNAQSAASAVVINAEPCPICCGTEHRLQCKACAGKGFVDQTVWTDIIRKSSSDVSKRGIVLRPASCV